MTFVTDYTAEACMDTLRGAPLTRYRFGHWLIDLLRNFLSDPVNIHDERLRGLLRLQDGPEPDACRALFKVEPPYSMDTRKAGTTPAILVNTGASSYPFVPINNGIGAVSGKIGAVEMYSRTLAKSLEATVAVVTESCDGTALLTDTLESFLVMNTLIFESEGFVSDFTVTGSSQVQRIQAGEAANAKDIYQSVIGIKATGGVTWTADTQGPVYRGMRQQARVN